MPTQTPTELMPIEEILKQLKRLVPGIFPRAALKQAIAQQAAITPALLEILAQATQNLKKIVTDPSYMAHLYALYLLAQFREPRAYPLIVDFFATPGEAAADATGDLVTEDLARILASVCDGDIALIARLIEDPNVYEYTRSSAVEALLTLVVNGLYPREALLAYFQTLFQGKLEREPSIVWATLADCSASLHFVEVQADIRQVFAEELIDESVLDQAWIDQRFATTPEKLQHEFQRDRHHHLVDNVIKEIAGWGCFLPAAAKPTPPPPLPTLPTKPTPKPLVAPPPQKGVPKIGRNVPCPCGSGKKYKLCCGRDQ